MTNFVAPIQILFIIILAPFFILSSKNFAFFSNNFILFHYTRWAYSFLSGEDILLIISQLKAEIS